jgi:hypothetical protein
MVDTNEQSVIKDLIPPQIGMGCPLDQKVDAALNSRSNPATNASRKKRAREQADPQADGRHSQARGRGSPVSD